MSPPLAPHTSTKVKLSVHEKHNLSHAVTRIGERKKEREREAMSIAGAAGYLTRRAAQKERVRILYRRALKDTLNWAVHRHLFYQDASELREKFEANKHVEDLDAIDRLIDDAEAQFVKFQHPDPYIGMLKSL
ncbi:NADH dehydrogenase [ubiquinone] 1 beta subcomplex subunit 9 [Rhynchospora pubera]|uniref:NADH dehydrogenase [ubiquinone] 1 beta subcomplex subunit 9 n=1 Tax=Rhynchospora pubera TaxID=906938 RepID=A0AAV8EC06_9POAL|nr:NADH dehydrogenase [ubiquinone] 1 beta subcomplex subunit 9 [Rhynchospora pubera]